MSARIILYIIIIITIIVFVVGGGGRRRGGEGEGVVADVAPVDDEDNSVADGVVARPHGAQGVLAAHVPDLEVHVVEGDGGYVLADGRDGGFGGGGGLVVEGFHGGEEGGFAGVVEAEEEDGVFCGTSVSEGMGRGGRERGGGSDDDEWKGASQGSWMGWEGRRMGVWRRDEWVDG